MSTTGREFPAAPARAPGTCVTPDYGTWTLEAAPTTRSPSRAADINASPSGSAIHRHFAVPARGTLNTAIPARAPSGSSTTERELSVSYVLNYRMPGGNTNADSPTSLRAVLASARFNACRFRSPSNVRSLPDPPRHRRYSSSGLHRPADLPIFCTEYHTRPTRAHDMQCCRTQGWSAYEADPRIFT